MSSSFRPRARPVGAFSGAFATVPAHELGEVAIRGGAGARQGGRRGSQRSHPGPGPDRRPGPESGPPGFHRGRHSRSAHRPGASTWSAARACARWRWAPRRSRNGDSRIVVAGGQESMSLSAHAAYLRAGQKMGDSQFHRHHDQGRAVGCLQRLSHGHHGGECRPAMADHPRAAGPFRRRLAEQGGSGEEGRPLQGRDRRR